MMYEIIYEPEVKKHNHGLEGYAGYLFTQAAILIVTLVNISK